MDKSLIKKCPECGMYYYANMPHHLKSCKCLDVEKKMEEFRKQNDIRPYEVYNCMVDSTDGMIFFKYSETQTLQNFMRMVYDKMRKDEAR